MIPGTTMKKGGRIAILAKRGTGKNKLVTITQINVWDRKLTSEEVADFSEREKCDGGAGNVLDWEDFKNQLDLSKFTKVDGSQCKSTSGSILY